MSTTEKSGWRRTSPLAVIFYIGRIIGQLAQNAVQTFAPLIAFLFAYQGDLKTKLIFIAIAFATFTLLASVLRYLFFRYKITDDSILIRDGVVKKTQLDIKFDRIQAINTEQNVVYRFFNLITVKFDTAGSAGQEGNLPAIRPELADTLREKIRRKKRDTKVVPDEVDTIEKSPRRKLLLLNSSDMVRIGLSDNRALIFLAFLAPLFEKMNSVIESMIDESTLPVILGVTIDADQKLSLGFVVVLGFLAMLATASIVGAFLRFHRYQLTESNDVFQSVGGLLTRHVHSINRGKIQTVVMTQNIILRAFGRFRLNARQASPGKKHGGKKNFAIPICLPDENQILTGEFFADEFPGLDSDPKSKSFRPIAFQYVRSRTVLNAMIPAVTATLMFSLALGWAALFILIWIPGYALVNWQMYRRYGVQVTSNGLALRRGFLGYRITSFLYRKVQRVGITQSIFQRRKGLATMRFYLASGTVRVPYVDHEKAQQLRDFVLFRIESSQQAWH